MKYRCKICGKEFNPKDYNVIALAYHIVSHTNRTTMPHDAIKEYDLVE